MSNYNHDEDEDGLPPWDERPYVIKMKAEQTKLDCGIALRNLAANLATAAFGQAMFAAGEQYCELQSYMDNGGNADGLSSPWRPNVERKALNA